MIFDVLVKHFHSLVVLQTVTRHGSLNRAAAALNMTQPAVTRNIARLEEALGFRLLDRLPSGVVPTIFGKELLGYVERASEEIQQGSKNLGILHRTHTNAVNCAGSTVNMTIIAAAAHRFSLKNDARSLHLIEGATPAMLELLRAGELDFVVGSHMNEPVDDHFVAEPLLDEQIGVFAAADHPIRARGRLVMAELLQTERWVIPDRGTHLYAYVLDMLQREQLQFPTKLVESRSVSAIRWMVQNTDCISFGTTLLHLPELLAGEVAPLDTDWQFPVTKHTIYRRPRPMMSRAALDLINEIKVEGRAVQAKQAMLAARLSAP